jgi:hypothetical protein
MKIGRPEQFFTNEDLRLMEIDRAIAGYKDLAPRLIEPLKKDLSEAVVYIKGFGNEIRLLTAFRTLIFPCRELLDLLLGKISRLTAGTKTQTPKDVIPFLKRLLAGEFDHFDLPIFEFLKTNATYIFCIRKMRNALKSNPASFEFYYDTDHFTVKIEVPVSDDELGIAQKLEIKEMEQLIAEKKYTIRCNLDKFFPEINSFLQQTYRVLNESEQLLKAR